MASEVTQFKEQAANNHTLEGLNPATVGAGCKFLIIWFTWWAVEVQLEEQSNNNPALEGLNPAATGTGWKWKNTWTTWPVPASKVGRMTN